jgi:hypothetical protein
MLLSPEIKITSDYINYFTQDVKWFKIIQNNNLLIMEDWFNSMHNDKYIGNIKIITRGNQYRIIFELEFETHWITLSSNNYIVYDELSLGNKKLLLTIETNIGKFHIINFSFFETIKFDSIWSYGPDIITQYQDFVDNLYTNIDNEEFKLPLIISIRNNYFFNGLGSYLYENVLYKLKDNPFQSLDFLLKKKNKQTENFLQLCKTTIMESYTLGGRQDHNWTNPFNIKNDEFILWDKSKEDLFVVLDTKKYYFNYKWAHCCPFTLPKSQVKKLKILQDNYIKSLTN